jgi:hypothetical protein
MSNLGKLPCDYSPSFGRGGLGRPASEAVPPNAGLVRARGLIIGSVFIEWPEAPANLSWDIYEQGVSPTPTLIVTVNNANSYSFGPGAVVNPLNIWVVPAGAAAPSETTPPMAQISGNASIPLEAIPQIIQDSQTSSLSFYISQHGTNIPQFAYIDSGYSVGAISPAGPVGYNAEHITWSFPQNLTGPSQGIYFFSFRLEQWSKWPEMQVFAESSIDRNGETVNVCDNFDKVYYTANGYGLWVETGRDFNSSECGFSEV